MDSAEATAVSQAAVALGWNGTPVAVRWAGESAWAIASLEPGQPAAPSSAVEIAGVVVTGTAGSRPAQRASVFAGYCRRAVLIPDDGDVLPVQVEAAVLDQGVVVAGRDGTRMLSAPGAARPGVNGAEVSARRAFAEHVYAALTAARAAGQDRS